MWTRIFVFTFLFSLCIAQDLQEEPAPDYTCPEDDPNGFFEHEEYCDKFYRCRLGEDPALVTCEDGLGFDHSRRFHVSKCDEFSNIDCGNRNLLQPAQPSADDVCPRQNGRYSHPDPTKCQSFVVCKQGKYVVKDCASGLHFNPIDGQCTWPAIAGRSGCLVQKKAAADGWICPDPDAERDPSEGPTDPNPTYAHPTDCAKFYICIGGTDPRPNACSFGLVFDITKRTCVPADEVAECADWYDDSKPSPANPLPTQPKIKKTRPPPPVPQNIENPDGSTSPPAKPFVCPPGLTEEDTRGDPNPKFPHPTDCTLFYVCIGFITPRLNKCSANLVYNIDTGNCDEPVNVPDCADWFDF